MTQPVFTHSKYAIVGAGLMGRLLAVALAQRGAQVDLFDKGDSAASGAAARIAAAMLAPLAESAITEDSVVRMGIHSLPRWKDLISALSKPVFFSKMAPSFCGIDKMRVRLNVLPITWKRIVAITLS